MSGHSSQIASLLSVISKKVQCLDEGELMSFIEFIDTWEPSESNGKRSPRGSNISSKVKMSVMEIDLSKLISLLENSKSRESSFQILESSKLSRTELTKLSKLLNVHITKNDTIEKIHEKIVEYTIGSKLRSQAVRGTN